jgi:nucleotide-binding universal stress UspA family protein
MVRPMVDTMSAVVLAVLDHPVAARGVLNAAACLAGLAGTGRINALLVRTPPEATIAQGEQILTAQRESELRAIEARRAAAIQAVFDAQLPAMEQAGIEARWLDVDGLAEMVVEERGSRADFLVLEQPIRHDYGPGWRALRAALFDTDRPVLVVPDKSRGDFGRRVAIAWRDDERATRAVLTGVRCLARAERVFVLAGQRDGRASPVMPAILAEHGVEAELHVMPIGPGSFGAALLNKAHELGADMLVMGAYMHHPLRELLFGGVTQYMLFHADIPVLMRH